MKEQHDAEWRWRGGRKVGGWEGGIRIEGCGCSGRSSAQGTPADTSVATHRASRGAHPARVRTLRRARQAFPDEARKQGQLGGRGWAESASQEGSRPPPPPPSTGAKATPPQAGPLAARSMLWLDARRERGEHTKGGRRAGVRGARSGSERPRCETSAPFPQRGPSSIQHHEPYAASDTTQPYTTS